MAKKAKVALPLTPIPHLLAWWQFQSTPGLIIGGVAASLLGRPRMTRDVDALVLVPENEWARFLRSGKRFGIVPRESDTLQFAEQTRVLLLRHRPTSIDVDIVLGALDFERETLARVRKVRIAGMEIPLATPEDLIVMKAIARREQDWFDIEGLLAANPSLDLRHIRRWLRAFEAALDADDIYSDFKQLWTRQKRSSQDK